MSQIIVNTVEDLRWGRQTWRVLMLVALPAFAAGIVAGLMP